MPTNVVVRKPGSIVLSVTANPIGTSVTAQAGTATGSAQGSAPYDLSGFAIPYTHTWPTAPNPAGSSSPSTNAALETAIQNGDATVTPAAGTYTISPSSIGTDLVLDLQTNNVTVNWDVNATGESVVKILGGTINGNGNWTDCDDWLFDNVKFEGDGGLDDIVALIGRIRRFGFVRCTWQSTDDSATWAIHTVQTDNGNGIRFDDITLADCRIDSSSGFDQVTRLNAVALSRLTIVDTIINQANKCVYGHRVMNGTDGFMENVINVQGIHNNWTAGNVDDAYIDGGNGGLIANNVHVFWDVNLLFLTAGADLIEGTLTGCALHFDGSLPGSPGLGGYTDGGGNTVETWDGSTSSIDYDVTAGKTSVSDYGADH